MAESGIADCVCDESGCDDIRLSPLLFARCTHAARPVHATRRIACLLAADGSRVRVLGRRSNAECEGRTNRRRAGGVRDGSLALDLWLQALLDRPMGQEGDSLEGNKNGRAVFDRLGSSRFTASRTDRATILDIV